MKQNHPHALGHPQLAIVDNNTLAAIGLATLIQKIIPVVKIQTFSSFEHLQNEDKGQFFHYFVSGKILIEHAMFFIERSHKTIVLLEGGQVSTLPSDFHTIDACLPQEAFIQALTALHFGAHGTLRGETGMAVRPDNASMPATKHLLTPREGSVLRLIVKGFTNKEIAEQLGVEITTVISHRKNLISKLGLKSVSALTMYAVAHGLVKVEEI